MSFFNLYFLLSNASNISPSLAFLTIISLLILSVLWACNGLFDQTLHSYISTTAEMGFKPNAINLFLSHIGLSLLIMFLMKQLPKISHP